MEEVLSISPLEMISLEEHYILALMIVLKRLGFMTS